MKALQCIQNGQSDISVLQEPPGVEPGLDEVVFSVRSCGIGVPNNPISQTCANT